VLADDGTLWLNLGDSYAGGGNGARDPERWPKQSRNNGGDRVQHAKKQTGAKSKDLLGIPWMVAFALRADGWYLRSDIIWSKPNPMPESVGDRPTKAHEQVFLLAKSARYYYDAVAIREPDKGTDHARRVHHEASLEPTGGLMSVHSGLRTTEGRNGTGANKRSVWDVPEEIWAQFIRWLDEQEAGSLADVWRVATQPLPDAHFATFPPKLIEPMVLAGCPADGTILDPFAGSGTVLQVAVERGRNAIGIELKPEYTEMTRTRLAGVTPPLFAEPAGAGA
jgi:DNA modification methylase